ncbi:MAG: hypothetical protein QM831_32165 [Kofleriaceae bacterium]
MANTFLVIGSSTGLGKATTEALARTHEVLTVGRHEGATVKADLRNLDDVKRAATELKGRTFAGIACNAGIQFAGPPELTPTGIEQTFAVNVLSHIAFIGHLAPAKSTRIGFVGSGTLDPENRGARRFGFRGGIFTDPATLAAGTPDSQVSVEQNARDRYATSKLCNLLTVRALAKRGVNAFAFDPGLMPGTGLAREYGPFARFVWSTGLHVAALFMPGASTATKSGRAYAWALEHAERGSYLEFHKRVVEVPKVAQRDDQADALYAYCLERAGIADPF